MIVLERQNSSEALAMTSNRNTYLGRKSVMNVTLSLGVIGTFAGAFTLLSLGY
jgi:hypothetical protein